MSASEGDLTKVSRNSHLLKGKGCTEVRLSLKYRTTYLKGSRNQFTENVKMPHYVWAEEETE